MCSHSAGSRYLYLTFSDDPELLPLDRWVFNTEVRGRVVLGWC